MWRKSEEFIKSVQPFIQVTGMLHDDTIDSQEVYHVVSEGCKRSELTKCMGTENNDRFDQAYTTTPDYV
ncbi:hypothetical protein EWB00_000128 [Schistosoma japonicum]|uniref:Uncharacterized protein n=1 Tax=Schistosoma japonicum TaxID=6182 RepID=A0A4Z2DK24_SCHJA|nr:hypothetical protein EWB00_000128 [Schistosoma japonicum]